MKNLKSLLLMLVATVFMTSCGGGDPLKPVVDGLASQLPFPVTQWTKVSGLESGEGKLDVNLTVTENDLLTIDNIQKGGDAVGKALGSTLFAEGGPLNKALAALMKENNTAVTLKLKGSASGKTYEAKIAAADVAKFAGAYAPEEKLNNRIVLDNLTCPYEVNDAVQEAARSIDGDNVVFTLLIKGSSYDGKLSNKELKDFVTCIFTDPSDGVSDYIALCQAANKGAKWIYKNADTGAQLTSTFTVDELKKLAE